MLLNRLFKIYITNCPFTKNFCILSSVFCLLIFLSFFPAFLNAGSSNTGTSSMLSLRIVPDARGLALGSARAAACDDISSIFWNPAGLANVDYSQVMVSNSQIFKDQSANYIAYAQPLLYGSIGVSIQYIDLGSFEVIKLDPNTGDPVRGFGTDNSNDIGFSVSYAYKQTSDLSIGGTLKYLRENLADESADGFCFDAGIQYEYMDYFRLGAAIENIGPDVKFIDEKYHLPWLMKAGIYSSIAFANLELEIQKPRSNNFGFNAGAEFDIKQMFFIRVGYDSLIDAGNGFSGGFGLKLSGFHLSYAYMDADELGNQHRITLSYKWGRSLTNLH